MKSGDLTFPRLCLRSLRGQTGHKVPRAADKTNRNKGDLIHYADVKAQTGCVDLY